MVNRTLPADWEWKTVGEVGKTITGNTPPKSDIKNYGDFIPFIKPPELNDGSLWNSADNLSEEGARLARVVPEKSVLVSCIGNLGKTGIAKRPIAFNQQINAIVFPENILPEYGFYYFQSAEFHKQLEDIASATTISIVNKSKFNSLSFPIAPFPEQERIVNRIEELLSDLEAGVAALERVQVGLNRYKASVLKAACEGKLLETSGVENSRELPEGWTWATVEELNPPNRKCSYSVLQPGFDKEDGILFVRVGDINDGRVDLQNLKRIDPEIAAKYPRTKLQGSEVLITLVGAIGRTAVVPENLAGANTARAVGVIPIKDGVHAPWVEIWFRNSEKVIEMTSKAHEVARKTLNLEDVRSAKVALPPLDEQQRIVAEVERRLSVVGEVESAVEVGLVRAGRLRQSVLRSAFEGRL